MMRAMRLCRGGVFGFLVLVLVGCATVAPPPPAPSVLAPRLAGYRSAADAPKVLEEIDHWLASQDTTAASLSTPDLDTYAHLLLAAGRFPEAEQVLLVLDGRRPRDREVLLALALLAGARGDRNTQSQRIQALEQAAPGDPAVADLRAGVQRASGDKKGAAATWTAVIGKTESPTALAGLASLALEAGDLKAALGYADRAVAAGPRDDGNWALRARIQQALDRPLAARQDLDRAVDLAPENPWHRLDRGKLAWLKLYDPGLARSDLEYAVILDPSSFFGWVTLGEVYEEQELPRKAYDAWMKALSLRPDYRFGYPSAAILSFRYLDFRRAAAFAREAAQDHPGEYAFPLIEALSLRALGQPQASAAVLEKARPRFVRGSTVDELFRFLLTPGSDYYLNTAMKLETKENVRIRLRFYQGCFYALTKAANSARAAFQETSESTLKHIPEIGAARDWLEHGP